MRMVLLSQIIGRSVTAADTGAHLGTVTGALVDPADGRLCAMRVRQGFLFVRRWVVLPEELRAWQRDIVVADVDALAREEDIYRLALVYPWVGLPVRTVSGARLGRVTDLAFDPALHHVVQLTVRGMVAGFLPLAERRLPPTAIVEVRPREILVEDRTLRRARVFLRSLRPSTASLAASPLTPAG